MTYSISLGNLYRQLKWPPGYVAYVIYCDNNVLRILEIKKDGVYLTSVIASFGFGFRYKQLS
mgnify:CR=1 FL=1